MAPNPYTATREEFTAHLVNTPAPASPPAKQEYIDVMRGLQKIVNLLAHHTAMAPNLHQTYMTPAASKNKIYFMWDFWGRTLGMLLAVDPVLSNKKQWKEIVMRSMAAAVMMHDPEKLDIMNAMPHPTYEIKDFGPEVMAAVREMEAVNTACTEY